jgi:hypothetical protein
VNLLHPRQQEATVGSSCGTKCSFESVHRAVSSEYIARRELDDVGRRSLRREEQRETKKAEKAGEGETYLQPARKPDSACVCWVSLRLQRVSLKLRHRPRFVRSVAVDRLGDNETLLAAARPVPAGVHIAPDLELTGHERFPQSCNARKARSKSRQLSCDDEVAPGLPDASDGRPVLVRLGRHPAEVVVEARSRKLKERDEDALRRWRGSCAVKKGWSGGGGGECL